MFKNKREKALICLKGMDKTRFPDSCPFSTNALVIDVYFFVVYSGKDVLKKIKEDTGGEFRTTLMNLIEVRSCWLLPQNSDWHLRDWTSLRQLTDVTACRILSSAYGSLWLDNEEQKLNECLIEDFPKTTQSCSLFAKCKVNYTVLFHRKNEIATKKLTRALPKRMPRNYTR